MTTKPECCAGYDCDACNVPEMALRDWFAGMALQGMLHEGFIPNDYDKDEGFNYVKAAFAIADSMMREREK